MQAHSYEAISPTSYGSGQGDGSDGGHGGGGHGGGGHGGGGHGGGGHGGGGHGGGDGESEEPDGDTPRSFCCCGAHFPSDLTFPPPSSRLFTPYNRPLIMLPKDRPVTLRYLRLFCHASQSQVAERIGVKQPTISKLEASSDAHVSTVRSYVEALNGRLELHAAFRYETISIDLPRSRR